MRAKRTHHHPAVTQHGFTMVEMLVVMGVILVLAGFLVPALARGRQGAMEDGTRVLVQAVVTAMASYGREDWIWSDPPGSDRLRSFPLWDLNQDGLVDGRPGLDPEPFDPAVVASGYAGFVPTAAPPLEARSVAPDRRVVDAWGNPLHLRYSARGFENGSFGVWSRGADGADNDGAGDDITSWEQP
jgi:prepilin-type N-terminal cleavage/methylation domain-containing protein